MWGGRCKRPVSGRRLGGDAGWTSLQSPWEAGPGLRGDDVWWPCPPGATDLAPELLLFPHYVVALADLRDCKVIWDRA